MDGFKGLAVFTFRSAVACQKPAPHNVAKYAKMSRSPNPPGPRPLLQPLLRYSIRLHIKHKHLWALNS